MLKIAYNDHKNFSASALITTKNGKIKPAPPPKKKKNISERIFKNIIISFIFIFLAFSSLFFSQEKKILVTGSQWEKIKIKIKNVVRERIELSTSA